MKTTPVLSRCGMIFILLAAGCTTAMHPVLTGGPVPPPAPAEPRPPAFEFVRIPAGSFLMGSPEGEPGRYPAEGPQTLVTISRPFWLGKTEVTQGQWQKIMGNNPSENAGDDRLPVENVSWNMAMEFCRKLTAQERAAGRLPDGYVYTLPTDAQWEYACRAGTTGIFPGDLDEIAWYNQNGGRLTHPVGGKKPNAWGLYDMTGNVWEWILDRTQPGAQRLPGGAITDPAGLPTGNNRIRRGGGVIGGPDTLRSASFNGDRDATFVSNNTGFRIALSVPAVARALKPVRTEPVRQVGTVSLRVAIDLSNILRLQDTAFLNNHTSLRDALANVSRTASAVLSARSGDSEAVDELTSAYATAVDEALAISEAVSRRTSESDQAVARAKELHALLTVLRP